MKISEEQYQLLSLFLEGELSSDELNELEKKIVEDASLRNALRLLLLFNEAGTMEAINAEGRSEKVNEADLQLVQKAGVRFVNKRKLKSHTSVKFYIYHAAAACMALAVLLAISLYTYRKPADTTEAIVKHTFVENDSVVHRVEKIHPDTLNTTAIIDKYFPKIMAPQGEKGIIALAYADYNQNKYERLLSLNTETKFRGKRMDDLPDNKKVAVAFFQALALLETGKYPIALQKLEWVSKNDTARRFQNSTNRHIALIYILDKKYEKAISKLNANLLSDTLDTQSRELIALITAAQINK